MFAIERYEATEALENRQDGQAEKNDKLAQYLARVRSRHGLKKEKKSQKRPRVAEEGVGQPTDVRAPSMESSGLERKKKKEDRGTEVSQGRQRCEQGCIERDGSGRGCRVCRRGSDFHLTLASSASLEHNHTARMRVQCRFSSSFPRLISHDRDVRERRRVRRQKRGTRRTLPLSPRHRPHSCLFPRLGPLLPSLPAPLPPSTLPAVPPQGSTACVAS